MKENNENEPVSLLRHRRITLEDGRYMIFYTFEGPLLETRQVPESRGEGGLGLTNE